MSLLELLNLLICDEPIRILLNSKKQKLVYEGFAMDIKDDYDYDFFEVKLVYSNPTSVTAKYYGDKDYNTQTVIVVEERR